MTTETTRYTICPVWAIVGDGSMSDGRLREAFRETDDWDVPPTGSFTNDPHHFVIREDGVADPIASCDYLIDAQRIVAALAAAEDAS